MGREDIERLRQKIAKDPDSKLFVPLAEEYRKAGMADEAINILNRGLEKQPAYLSARVSLGKAYMDKGLLDKAKDEFLKVIAVIPENLYSHKKLAEIYRELGERDKTISELRIALTLNPADEWALSALAAVENGPLTVPEGNQARAASGLPETPAGIIPEVQEEPASPVEIFPDGEAANVQPVMEGHGTIYNAFLDAESFIRQGKYTRAMDIYRTALSGDPENIQVLQRAAELKNLLRIAGKDKEAHIMLLQRFIEGIKKRRDEFSGGS